MFIKNEGRETNTADYVVVVCEMGFAFSAAEYFVGVEVDVVCEAHFDVWDCLDLTSKIPSPTDARVSLRSDRSTKAKINVLRRYVEMLILIVDRRRDKPWRDAGNKERKAGTAAR
jgi:hypothetical protein